MDERIKDIVLEACKGKDWAWEKHIRLVVGYCAQLSEKTGADPEVCEAAAWLHDIAKIRGKEMHHVKGAEEARQILAGFGYPNDKIDKIAHCILTHSSDSTYKPVSKEAKVLASADAMSHFDLFVELAYYFIAIRKDSADEARAALLKKFSNGWDKMMPEAREMARPKFEAAMLLCRNI